MRNKVTILIAAAASLLALSGCKHGEAKVTTAAPIPVQTVRVEEVKVDASTQYSASIEPDTTVEMAFRVDGYVDSLLKVGGRDVQVGDFVPRGAILARVRQSEFRAGLDGSRARALQAGEALNVAAFQLSQVEALYTKASLDADRATALYEQKAMTKPEFDAARAQLDSMRAQVEAARRNVEAQRGALKNAKAQEQLDSVTFGDTALVSPMASIVLDKRVEQGSLVGRGIPVFRLGAIATVRMAIGVPDTTVTNLKLGGALPVRVDAFPDQTFEGQIREIAAAADPSTRLFRIEVAIPNPKQQLKAGMMGKVSISGTQGDRHLPAVPAMALLRAPSDPQAAVVYVVEGGPETQVARLRTVRLGPFTGSRATVLAGLSKGEQVVTGGRQNLVDGSLIRVARQGGSHVAH
jgi:RND family efflux transporter MFP subunit